MYGFTDIHEFISEAVSNISFMRVLDDIPSPNKEKNSIFDDFLNAIKTLFKELRGGFAGKEHSILDDIFNLFNTDNFNIYEHNNVSKVVDENGEPLVVYHNTPFEFNGIFDMDHKSRIIPWTSEPFGHVGTQETANKIKGTQFALFLNIRNPLETPDFVHETVNSMLSELYKQGIISKEKYSSLRGISNSELRDLMLSLGYDGTKYENKAERGGTSYSFITPNQIKSATDNVGTFSRTDDDIRYREVPNSSFKSLDTEMQENLLKKGWTAEKFDSISQEERNQAVKCIAF